VSGYQEIGNTWSQSRSATSARQWTHLPGPGGLPISILSGPFASLGRINVRSQDFTGDASICLNSHYCSIFEITRVGP
jgi:hypothetical protein